MSTLQRQIRDHDERLDNCLRRQVGISVQTYKALSFAFRAIGIAIVAAAMLMPTVEPRVTTLLILAAFVLGPDVVETYLTRQEGD